MQALKRSYVPKNQRKPMQIMLSLDEWQTIADAAQKAGLSQSSWVRAVALQAAATASR